MEFLPQQNRRCEGDSKSSTRCRRPSSPQASACVIIGGGDTGADCLGTSHRQGAMSVHQFEIMPKPPDERAASTPWPLWPLQLRTESSHEEGGIRDWSINSVKFTGDEHGNVKQLHCVRVGPPPKFEAIAGTEFTLDVDLVLLAMGFLGPVRNGMIEQLGVALDKRGNVATDATTCPRSKASSPPATCAAASRSSSGPSPKAAKPPPPSTSTLPRRKTCPHAPANPPFPPANTPDNVAPVS